MEQILITDIVNGKYDTCLDKLATIIHDRRKEIRRKKAILMACTLDRGDRIELLKIRPSSIIGEKGTILCVKKTRAEVEMDNVCGRYGKRFTVPLSCVKKIA